MRRPAIGVHIGDMLIGLVAVRILPDQPRNVGRGIVGQCRRTVEQRIELLLERRVAAEMLDQPIKIMLVEEGRLPTRSEEHTSELQSLMRNSYAVFCL